MRYSKDIETALQEALTSSEYSASAHALPPDLGGRLPHVHVVRTGGYEKDMVLEINSVDFDVYADDDADAMTAACRLCGWIRDLAGDFCYVSEITTLPYRNPDPRHPSIARATIKAQITTRTV